MSHKNCKCVECGQTGKMQEMMNKGIIENGFIVQLPDGRSMRAFNVIGVDL